MAKGKREKGKKGKREKGKLKKEKGNNPVWVYDREGEKAIGTNNMAET